MLQSLNSDKRQEKKPPHAHKPTAGEGSPLNPLRYWNRSPLKDPTSPVSCHLASISFWGSCFSLNPSPSKTHKAIYHRAATSFMFVCAAQMGSQTPGLFVQWEKRDGSNFLSKNGGLAPRPVPAWRRALAWQRYLPQTPPERINHHQQRSPPPKQSSLPPWSSANEGFQMGLAGRT